MFTTARRGAAKKKSIELELIEEVEHLLNRMMQPLEPSQDFVHDLRHRLDAQPPARIVRIPAGFFSSILYIVASVISSALLVALGLKGLQILKDRWQQRNQAPTAFTRGQA
jgi:hypothetical protein